MVEEHVEALVRRQDRVEVVPGHRLGLAGEDAENDHRAVRDPAQGLAGLRRQVPDERRDQGSGDRDDGGPRLDLAAAAVPLVADADAGTVQRHLANARAEAQRVAERRRQRSREPARAASHVAAEIAGVPDMAEQGRHRRLRDLPRLGDRSVRDRPVDLERLGMQRPEEIREALVTAVLERAQPDRGVGVARARLDELHVAVRVGLEPQPGARERHPPGGREREQEREQLGSLVPDELAPEEDVQHRARDRHHLEAELGHEPAHDRVRRREHVGAHAEREIAALLREDPPAGAVLRLEHERANGRVGAGRPSGRRCRRR